MLAFTEGYIEKNGGKVVGEEYLPMDGSDWTSIISKLKGAGTGCADHLDGRRRAKRDIDKAASRGGRQTAVRQSRGRRRNGEERWERMRRASSLSASYVTGIETRGEQNLPRCHGRRSSARTLKTPNDLSVPEYEAVYAYKAAVEKAGSTNSAAVLKALAEVSVAGPRGTIVMSKQHHAPLSMYLGQVQGDGSVKVIKSFPERRSRRAVPEPEILNVTVPPAGNVAPQAV